MWHKLAFILIELMWLVSTVLTVFFFSLSLFLCLTLDFSRVNLNDRNESLCVHGDIIESQFHVISDTKLLSDCYYKPSSCDFPLFLFFIRIYLNRVCVLRSLAATSSAIWSTIVEKSSIEQCTTFRSHILKRRKSRCKHWLSWPLLNFPHKNVLFHRGSKLNALL